MWNIDYKTIDMTYGGFIFFKIVLRNLQLRLNNRFEVERRRPRKPVSYSATISKAGDGNEISLSMRKQVLSTVSKCFQPKNLHLACCASIFDYHRSWVSQTMPTYETGFTDHAHMTSRG